MLVPPGYGESEEATSSWTSIDETAMTKKIVSGVMVVVAVDLGF